MKKLAMILAVAGVVLATSTAVKGGTVTRLSDSTVFATIQAAIDDAGTVNGETLTASAGTYNESVVVNKSLTLEGSKANVDPRGGAWAGDISIIDPGVGGYGVDIQASNVTLNGFEIKGGMYGVYIGYTDASSVNVSYNDVHDNTKYGIQAIGIDSDISFVNTSYNYIHENDRNGIKLVDVTDCLVQSNEIASNGASGTKPEYQYGVFLEDERYNAPIYSPALRNRFIENSFHDNALGAINMEVMGNAVSSFWTSTEFLEGTEVQYNNFLGPASICLNVSNDYEDNGSQDGFGDIATINAKCNWWGDAAGPDAGDVIGLADVSTWLDGPYPGGNCIPEPGTMCLLGIGGVGLLLRRRSR